MQLGIYQYSADSMIPGSDRRVPEHRPRGGTPIRALHGTGTQSMAKTVLIVEDNELNMKLFHDLLEAHGYKTI